MDFLRRSFFQETEEHEFPFFQETELDSPHFYKMHDLIHDLAKEVAGREFFSIIKAEDTEIIPDQSLHTSCLFKIDDSSSFPNSFYRKHMKLRTFIYLNGSPNSVISNSTLERMISSFARLRVLHLRHLQIKFQPQSLGRLKHLRYLSISSKSIFNLPNSITNLHKLQILNLVCCFKLKKLPRDIWRLVRLRCLDFKHCSSLEDMPPGIGQLTPLRTLTSFIIDKESCISSLASDKLNELKGLLSVKFEYGNHKDDAGADLIMLEALQPHQNIECLEILNYSGQGFCSKCQKLPLLWKLSSLQSLELRYLDGLEGYDDKFMLPSNTPIDECYFSSLKRLELEKINEKILKQILCPPHHPSPLCNLKDLSLDSLEGLATMPEDVFKNLRSLQSLELPTARVVQRRGNAISGPGNLSTFSVVGLDKIMSLPIRHFSGTLKSIDITECPNFATILDWIGDLIALNRLAIDDSPMLKSLPEGMQSLTALQKLIVIGGSSILKQRFKKEIGEDWPKIAHVPTVDIDDDWN
ncbi:putative oxidation resistance protein 1-like isoform X1 [Capsicum annuum]|nr:putative oxidation resistance protein 1-like isoform X1 [Capsicum annuum]